MPLAHAPLVIRKLERLFGESKEGAGLFGRTKGHHWPGGLRVACDDPLGNSQDCIVEMPGGFLQPLSMDDKLGLIGYLLLKDEARCTRIDVANDWRGEGIDLVERITDACHRGELSRAKRWEPDLAHSGPDIVKDQICIGTRGKDGSGRYVRCYDKGLEQRSAARGCWVRWEAEFAKGVADQVARAILESEDPIATARGYAIGAVEFREANGKRIRDRPMCAWWQAIIENVETLRAKMPRTQSDFDKTMRWMACQVMPTMQGLADLVGLTLEGFRDKYMGKIRLNPETLMRKPATHQFLRILAGSA